MAGPMEVLAEAARKFGGVDPRNVDAVVDFLENHSDKIPDDEAEKVVAALLQHNETDFREDAEFDGAFARQGQDLEHAHFPKLDDARRDAKLYEELQELKRERSESSLKRERSAKRPSKRTRTTKLDRRLGDRGGELAADQTSSALTQLSEQTRLTRTLVSRLFLSVILVVVVWAMPDGASITSSSARVAQTALGVAGSLSAISLLEKAMSRIARYLDRSRERERS